MSDKLLDSGLYYEMTKDGSCRKITDEQKICSVWETNRIIGSSMVGDSRVSTVFLVIDHNMGGDYPILFETMVFGGYYDGHCERYASKKEAVYGHEKIVNMVGEHDSSGLIVKFFKKIRNLLVKD